MAHLLIDAFGHETRVEELTDDINDRCENGGISVFEICDDCGELLESRLHPFAHSLAIHEDRTNGNTA